MNRPKRVIIVGAGFAGLTAAKHLHTQTDLSTTIVDRQNHHLFQPLLYQVAMAGLSPAEIAVPIRSLLKAHKNFEVVLGEVTAINLAEQKVTYNAAEHSYDYLILALGATQSYFGNDQWQTVAPGLKTLEEATDIRRRVLLAFENAERIATDNKEEQRKWLTFVVVGGGPTGVELAGTLGELSRFTLAKDFTHIDPTSTRIFLIEAGPRILPTFSPELARKATVDLEKLGVQIWVNSMVSNIDEDGVTIGEEYIRSSTVLWAAGISAAPLSKNLGVKLGAQNRVQVTQDLSIENYPNVFVIGDQACFMDPSGRPLPAMAPVAIQMGEFVARSIKADLAKLPRPQFTFKDKGQLATIGRRRAIMQFKRLEMSGFAAWLVWIFVHIYYLIGFKNKFFVLVQWIWAYISYQRGARLIITPRDPLKFPPL